ncbi:MAG: LysM domain-containing protein [Polyangiales bacterium]
MKRYPWWACALGLWVGPSVGGHAQDSADVESSDFGDYFGDTRSHAGGQEGPHTLGEAKAQGRAYRLGQPGNAYHKTAHEQHTVHEGDTLWDISQRYFGDPWHWPELWSYNPEITNPHWIYPLDRIRLSASALDDEQAVAAASGTPAAQRAGFAEPAHGRPTDLAPRVTVPGKLLEGGAVFLRDEGYLDDDEIKESGQLLAAGAEQMLLSDSDTVYVRFHKGKKVSVGQQYTVYRPIYDREREDGEQGKLVRIQGTLLVTSFDPKKGMARAVVTETIDPIERGMPVTLMERRFILESPRPNRRNVVAHIIGSTQPRRLLAYGNVVFLDVGRDKGIVPGNRFFVVRRGDNWLDVLTRPADQMGNIMDIPTYHPEDLPKEVVAEMRVIKVRKKVVIAVITQSKTDVFQGETVEMRVGY